MNNFSAQNLEAEAFLLALILRDPSCIDELPTIKPVDFSGKNNRNIYQAVQRLIREQEPVDVPHINGYTLHSDPPVEEDYVRSIMNLEVPPGSPDKYFKLVREQKVLTNSFRFGGQVAELVTNFSVDDDVESMVDKIEKGALKIRDELEIGESFHDASDVLSQIAIELNSPKEERVSLKKVPTGFPEIDTFINGMRGGEMVMIVARPSDGKTALMLQMAVNVHLQHKVGILSLEMPASDLMTRVASNLSGVSYKCVESEQVTPEERQQFLTSCENFPHDRIIIDDSTNLTAEQIRGKVRRMVRAHGCEIIMLDYLQRISLPNTRDSTADKIQYVSNEINSVLKEMDVPGVILAQLNRDSEKEDRVPRMSDIRGSGSLEQDADHIFAPYRPDGHKNPQFDIYHLKGRNTGEMLEHVQLFFETDIQRIVPVVSGELFLPDVYNK